MKVYQVIFQDEWNNLYEIGWYKDLADALDDINAEIGDDRIKVTTENFGEYAGTFSPVFDLCLGDLCEDDDELLDEFGCKYIRGFVYDLDSVLDTLRGLKND